MSKFIILITIALTTMNAAAQPQSGTFEAAVVGGDSLPKLPNAGAYNEKGEEYAKQGQYDLAIRYFCSAIKLDPGEGRYYTNRGWSHYWRGEDDLAIADGEQALILKSESISSSYRLVGRAYKRKNDMKSARVNFAAALNSTPENCYHSRGLIYTDMEEYEKAISSFDLAISLRAWEPSLFFSRGVAYYRQKKYSSAIDDLSTALVLKPDYPLALEWRGFAYQRSKDYASAGSDFDRAIMLRPENPELYSARAQLYADQKQYEPALRDINQAIQLDPNSPAFYMNRADIYSAMGNCQSALSDYNKAVEINPGDAKNYVRRAVFFLFGGKYSLSVEDNTKSLELAPASFMALLNRAVAFYYLGNYENAAKDCDAIIELTREKKNFYFHGAWGLKYCCQGKHGKAVDEYSRAIKARPDWAGAYDRRGEAYDKLGKRASAIADWTKANLLNSHYPLTAEARSAIGAVEVNQQEP